MHGRAERHFRETNFASWTACGCGSTVRFLGTFAAWTPRSGAYPGSWNSPARITTGSTTMFFDDRGEHAEIMVNWTTFRHRDRGGRHETAQTCTWPTIRRIARWSSGYISIFPRFASPTSRSVTRCARTGHRWRLRPSVRRLNPLHQPNAFVPKSRPMIFASCGASLRQLPHDYVTGWFYQGLPLFPRCSARRSFSPRLHKLPIRTGYPVPSLTSPSRGGWRIDSPNLRIGPPRRRRGSPPSLRHHRLRPGAPHEGAACSSVTPTDWRPRRCRLTTSAYTGRGPDPYVDSQYSLITFSSTLFATTVKTYRRKAPHCRE